MTTAIRLYMQASELGTIAVVVFVVGLTVGVFLGRKTR